MIGYSLVGKDLRCVRDRRVLFSTLELQLAAGDILQIEGSNGAGKTSLLRILCGLLQPQEGAVHWHGIDIRKCRLQYHANLLYIGHYPGLKEELTPLDNLRFYHALGAVDGDLEAALDKVGLFGFEDVPVRSLSAGQRRRVALARLWLSQAPLWLLDEPLTAIDSTGVAHLEERLLQHRTSGGSIVLTSHQALQLASVRRLRLQ